MFDTEGVDLVVERAYLGLGSNVGPREFNVLRAAAWVGDTPGITVRKISSLYETEPIGCVPMRPFVNAVVEIDAALDGDELLERMQGLERALGRVGGHNEPRTIDIDIIALGARKLASDALTLPHPRYAERAFVLVPLREIAPGFVCPASGHSVDRLLLAAPPGAVQRISARGVRCAPLHSEV